MRQSIAFGNYLIAAALCYTSLRVLVSGRFLRCLFDCVGRSFTTSGDRLQVCLAVLRSSQSVYLWGQADVDPAARRSAFELIGCDVEIVKVIDWAQAAAHVLSSLNFSYSCCVTKCLRVTDLCFRVHAQVALLLTGAFHGTKNQVAEYMTSFRKYDWLWKDDMEVRVHLGLLACLSCRHVVGLEPCVRYVRYVCSYLK